MNSDGEPLDFAPGPLLAESEPAFDEVLDREVLHVLLGQSHVPDHLREACV